MAAVDSPFCWLSAKIFRRWRNWVQWPPSGGHNSWSQAAMTLFCGSSGHLICHL